MSAPQRTEWTEAQRRCPLTEEAVAMAKELGLSPRALLKNIPNRSQQWKAPVEDWVRGLFAKRFGERRPERPVPAPERQVFAPEPPPDAVNKLEVAREEIFRRFERGEVGVDAFGIEMEAIEHEIPVSGGEINEENRILRLRYECFRRFAEMLATVAAKLDFVQRIVLFGSVAAPLKKEVPRFRRFRQARIAVWHECKDVDLAVWVSGLTRLRELRCAVSDATNRWQVLANQEPLPGIPHDSVDVFLMAPGSNSYRGNLCHYAQCPKGKPACEVAGCGAQPFLRLYDNFKFDRLAPFGEHAVVLFDRDANAATPSDTVPF